MMVLRIKEQETRLTLQEHDGVEDQGTGNTHNPSGT